MKRNLLDEDEERDESAGEEVAELRRRARREEAAERLRRRAERVLAHARQEPAELQSRKNHVKLLSRRRVPVVPHKLASSRRDLALAEVDAEVLERALHLDDVHGAVVVGVVLIAHQVHVRNIHKITLLDPVLNQGSACLHPALLLAGDGLIPFQQVAQLRAFLVTLFQQLLGLLADPLQAFDLRRALRFVHGEDLEEHELQG
mmetsp:Transcript_47617/g.136989  ORF Transcript_47617/g.136989 Transcript_47617/m.136989 type:complete len:203 (+) Transcript_47617:185-793(+)